MISLRGVTCLDGSQYAVMASILRLSAVAVLLAFAVADLSEEYFDYYQEGFNGPYKTLSVCVDNHGQLFTKDGTDCDRRVALGKFRNAINQTGWSFLEVETSDEFEPEIQAYAAGVAEGILTRTLITYQWRNTREDYCVDFEGYCDRLHDFLQKNMKWLRSQLVSKPKSDLYWNQTMKALCGQGKRQPDELTYPSERQFWRGSPFVIAYIRQLQRGREEKYG
uniref:Phospholipase B-like n=1 Tax=Plectus sambesii TaxID=2011161 RepID=A0A914VBR3_9BILA